MDIGPGLSGLFKCFWLCFLVLCVHIYYKDTYTPFVLMQLHDFQVKQSKRKMDLEEQNHLWGML